MRRELFHEPAQLPGLRGIEMDCHTEIADEASEVSVGILFAARVGRPGFSRLRPFDLVSVSVPPQLLNPLIAIRYLGAISPKLPFVEGFSYAGTNSAKPLLE